MSSRVPKRAYLWFWGLGLRVGGLGFRVWGFSVLEIWGYSETPEKVDVMRTCLADLESWAIGLPACEVQVLFVNFRARTLYYLHICRLGAPGKLLTVGFM